MWHTTCNYNLLENILIPKWYLIINIFNRLFNSINYIFGCLIDLKFLFALWKYPLEGVPKNMCLKYIGKIVEKNWSFQSSSDSSSVTADTGAPFSIPPNITPQKSLRCGVMMCHWPKITLALANLYPKLWGNGELLNFLICCKQLPWIEIFSRDGSRQ